MPNLSSALYFIRFRGQTTGPVDRKELRKMAQRGGLSRIHEISADQMLWRPAGEFGELFGEGDGDDLAELIEAVALPSGAAGRAGEGRYFYSHHSATVGPVSLEVLCAQAARGSLRPTDPVWREGCHDAVLAAHLEFLRRPLAEAPRARRMSGGQLLLSGIIIVVVIAAITVAVIVGMRRG